MIFDALLWVARLVDRLLGQPSPTARPWPAWVPFEDELRIDAARVSSLLSQQEATELAEQDAGAWSYTPPDPDSIDRSRLGIDPW